MNNRRRRNIATLTTPKLRREAQTAINLLEDASRRPLFEEIILGGTADAGRLDCNRRLRQAFVGTDEQTISSGRLQAVKRRRLLDSRCTWDEVRYVTLGSAFCNMLLALLDDTYY